MLWGFFGSLIFAIIARMLCGNHLKSLQSKTIQIRNQLILPISFFPSLWISIKRKQRMQTTQNIPTCNGLRVNTLCFILQTTWPLCRFIDFLPFSSSLLSSSTSFNLKGISNTEDIVLSHYQTPQSSSKDSKIPRYVSYYLHFVVKINLLTYLLIAFLKRLAGSSFK